MTVPAEQPSNANEVLTFLVESGLLEKGASISLTEYKPAFPRQPSLRRWHYHVRRESEDICHLIVGMKLATLHDRAQKMSAACPEISCQPLLFSEKSDGMGFLCLQHFQGESLDSLVEQGHCDAVLWLNYVRRAQKALERTTQVSTEKQLVHEVRSLIDEACGYPGLSEFDIQFLRGPAQRSILTGTIAKTIHRQWSNGDFAGRNLLINSQGDLRLIDYEYAEFTHFGHGDWLRLMEFSLIPSDLASSSVPEMEIARQPRQEVRLWIHQLVQLKSAQPSPTLTQHLTEAIGRLVGAVGKTIAPDSLNGSDSLLIKLIADRQLRDESMIEERTAWAKSLEVELVTAQKHFKKLSDEHAERSAWAKSLEVQLTTAQGHFEKLNQEFNERTAWAESLQVEYQRTQKHFEKLNQDFSERTAWALAMEAELKTIRPSHQQQSQMITALSAERDDLKAECDGIREQKNASDSDLSEIKLKCAELANWIRRGSEKGTVAILEQALVTLAELKRDLAIKNAEADRIAASQLDARLTAEAAALEVLRLTATLKDAQIHLEGLLQQSVELRERNSFLETAKIEAEHTPRENILPSVMRPPQ